jgi:hypothetical protein
MKIMSAVALLLGLGAAAGQVEDWGDAKDEIASSPEFEPSKAVCRRLKDRQPPPSDRPDRATAARLKGCDSEALYYGIGVKADPVRARQCAFTEMEDEAGGSPFSGRTMLMTIYANGLGAKRDLDVATHLACGIDGAPAESHGRVLHLQDLKTRKWAGSDFHFCDDITSGLAMGYCADHQASIAGTRREAALAELTRPWTGAEKQAFRRLQQAHAAFVEAHGNGEVDLSGTARAAMQINAEERLRDELLDMLQRQARGEAPRLGPDRFRSADAALNAAYRRRIEETIAPAPAGAVTRAGIREAQRAWLRYRDAFLAFARIKFPQVPRDSLATWLTENRTAMLVGV